MNFDSTWVKTIFSLMPPFSSERNSKNEGLLFEEHNHSPSKVIGSFRVTEKEMLPTSIILETVALEL